MLHRLCRIWQRPSIPNGAMPTTAPEYVVFEGPGMDALPNPGVGSSLVISVMYYELTEMILDNEIIILNYIVRTLH